jgi:membrane fusion protein, macrolide-specific efflux system
VVSQNALEGQTLNAVQSAPVIVQIANLDVMTVWAQVAEADVNRIRPGMPAYFTTLGMPGRRWHGSVRQVQPTPQVENDVVLYNVLIDVDNDEGLLLPSMTVQVFFALGEARDVPVVPLDALIPDPQAGPGAYRATVLTLEGAQPRSVKVGLANRTTAQVLSGLEVGERVVVGSAASADAPAVRAGGTVRIMPPL